MTAIENKTIRVLHLIHWLNPGGIEKWLVSMVENIDRAICQMDFSCKGEHTGIWTNIVAEQGCRVHHTRMSLFPLDYIHKINELIKKFSYDLIHNHLQTYSGLGVWIAKRCNIPVVTSYHNTAFNAQTWLKYPIIRDLRKLYSDFSVNYAIQNSNLITGCSSGVIQNLNEIYRLEKEKTRILYYGVKLNHPADETKRRDFRCCLNWEIDCPIIIHVGSFKEQKNHKGIIDVFKRVQYDIRKAKLLLVGDGPLRNHIERYAQEVGVKENVRFLGLRDDVDYLLSISDIFLLPSFHEGFGLVALEANASGLPVVGSKVAGLQEAVQDGKTAILHNVENISGMAESILSLLCDRRIYNEFRNEAIKRVAKKFTNKSAAENLFLIYASLVQSAHNVPNKFPRCPLEIIDMG